MHFIAAIMETLSGVFGGMFRVVGFIFGRTLFILSLPFRFLGFFFGAFFREWISTRDVRCLMQVCPPQLRHWRSRLERFSQCGLLRLNSRETM